MKDKNTIINEMMVNATYIMDAAIKYNELVAIQTSVKDPECAARLRATNVRIQAAIDVIMENAGCWA